ncbi:ATP-dependent DNA helicase RecG [Thermosynechococcus sp. NK55a]|uniref:ATP-dependent DNA helicase RecG n=2 Tax=unclassified Thermosynechococcus TaxID=2622553 RepID=UPI0003D96079|nr:ATP-dependent DNA helicase RecG [Thermosynechococcus sp. NK55a]AHB89278.1 ATP-dependent DNA helicase RecG [Thermosynechococcus sp. NK55a]
MSLDWPRLQRALAIETERGFCNLQGNTYRFNEYLHEALTQAPLQQLPPQVRDRWQKTAAAYAHYNDLSPSQRQHLVVKTRQLLHDVHKQLASSPPRSRPLDQALKTVHGIGEQLRCVVGDRPAAKLAKLGLYTVADLIYYFPRDHIDYARQVPIRQLQAGETVTLVGKVRRCNCFTSPRNAKLTILEIILQDRTGEIRLSRFYAGARYAQRGWQEQQKRLYAPQTLVAASGLVKRTKYGLTLEDPELEVLDHAGAEIDSLTIGRIVPVYPLTEGISPEVIRRAVARILPLVQGYPDPLPQALRQRHQLMPLDMALRHIHFPPDQTQLSLARRRLIFDEFFYLQLGLLQRRRQQQQQASAPLKPQGELIEQFYQRLPFQLTGAQQRVVAEILADLEQPIPMNRLLQGDVGSGKTVVAVIALLAAVQSGYQGALMAPTEVLAEQHYRKLFEWLTPLHVPVELLTGSVRTTKRRRILDQLATGELPVLVGTHALIQEGVRFQRLGLVVIDEQHRFGVAQRAKLQAKGVLPHVLTMTATPIPRTLALTLHGDLDVSQIDELPPGRQPIQTTILGRGDRSCAYDLIRREVAQGRQAYIVLPLVEESEKVDLKSAIAEHKRLQTEIFPNFRVGLLHGRMASSEKDATIQAFAQGQLDILVATTVIEVGVDVPNATVMLIEDAERFGLSQLHQLRGRVGRGAQQSYCLLLLNSARNDAARQRLNVLAQSQDGFFIAEMDLRLRGPGEVLGTRQSGLPDFALASLVEDQDCLEAARLAATELIAEDPELRSYPLLQAALQQRRDRLRETMMN